MSHTKFIWLGASTHAPEKFPCSYADGFIWQRGHGSSFASFLESTDDTVFGDSDRFEIVSDIVCFDGVPLSISLNTVILMGWNHSTINWQDYEKLCCLEDYFRSKSCIILNPISLLPIIESKNAFFNTLQANSLPTPNFTIVTNGNTAPLSFPFIMKLNNLSGGEHAYFVQNLLDFREAYEILRHVADNKASQAKSLVVTGKERPFSKTAILAVEYINPFNATLGLNVAGRVFIYGNDITFSYANVSRQSWNLHCKDTGEFDDKAAYIRATQHIKNAIQSQKAMVTKMVKSTGLSVFGIDFLLVNDKPVFLEAEIKWGPDDNFYRNHHQRFQLGQQDYESFLFDTPSVNNRECFNRFLKQLGVT